MLDADPETMRFFPDGVRSRQQIENNIKKYITAYNEKGYSAFVVFIYILVCLFAKLALAI